MNNIDDLILLVDDSLIDREAVKSLLIRSGYRVETVSNSKEALERVKQSIPRLVLLDVVLPDESGCDVCRAIKDYSRQNDCCIPVILLASLNQLKNKVEIQESGADDFVSKPPVPVELLARIRNLLRLSDLQNNLHDVQRRLAEARNMITREMNRIGEMQRSFLPLQLPSHAHVELAACYYPSTEAGGDYYDAIPLDDNRWALVMADIAGHGASAAVVMAIAQMAVKDIAPSSSTPREALSRINDKLSGHLHSRHFITMFYAILSLKEREMIYASAGHNPMLYYSGAEVAVRLLEAEPSFPLCTFPTDGYKEYRRRFEPGDKVLLYTDGAPDMQNRDREFYGLERLAADLFDYRSLSPRTLIDAIFRDTEAFRGETERVDDFTLMAIGFR